MKIFTQEGALYEWSDKHGISLEYEVVTLFQEERVDSDDEEDSPVAVMGICLHEVRKDSEQETKSKINGKLKTYLEQHYPKEHQQIHAHVMSLNARAFVGVLLTPGLLINEIKHIVGETVKKVEGERV